MEQYTQSLIAEGKSPQNFGELQGATDHKTRHNMFCGDTIHVHIQRDGESLNACTFTGRGCLLCMASASFMTQWVRGQHLSTVQHLIQRMISTHDMKDMEYMPEFLHMMELMDARTIAGRSMCVKLPWLALQDILAR